MNERTPIFNVPSIVIAALAVLVCVHGVRSVLPEDLETWFVLALAFIPARYDGYAEALPGGLVSAATSFVSHLLVHAHVAHLMLNAAWLLAFGGAIALRVGGFRFVLFAFLCGAAGAAAFLALNWGLLAPMIGASGAVAGLMAGTFRFLFSAIDQGDMQLLRMSPRSVRLMRLTETLRDRRVLAVTGVWLGINLLAAAGVGIIEAGTAIAWEAHVGGYFAGLLLFGLFERASEADVAAPDNLR